MSRKPLATLLLLTSVLLGGTAAANAADTRLGIVVETLGNPYFACLKAGAEAEAAKHPEMKLTVIGAATGTDLVGMTRMIDDMLQKGVDVISFNAIDPNAMVQTVKKAKEKGVKVLMHSDDTAEPVAEHYVGANQYEIENVVAGMLASQIGGKGKVAIIEGVPGNMTSVQRKKGAMDAFAKYPDIKVVGVWAGNWDRAQGLQKAQDILTAHPDLAGILAVNDEMALGALQAVRARNLAGKVVVTGANGVPESLKAVYKGDLGATVVTYCSDIGEAIVTTALAMQNGKDDKPYNVDTRYDAIDTRVAKTVFDGISK